MATKHIVKSTDSSPLEKELGLKEGMHGKTPSTSSGFVQDLVANLGPNYIVLRSYNTGETFDPKVVLCGESHTRECREDLKKVVDAVIQPEDIVLLEHTNFKAGLDDDDPFKEFSGKVKKMECNDNPMMSAAMRAAAHENEAYVRTAITRNRWYFAPSIIRYAQTNQESRIFQRIGHRHIIEWMEILQELEKNKIPYIAIIPKVNPGYTAEQNNRYNRLARTTASVEF